MPYYQNPFYDPDSLPSTFSSVTAIAPSGWNPLERFDLKPYLCQLMKNATNPNIDPVIRIEQAGDFDYENYLNPYYVQLTAMKGDGRVDFYQVWDAVRTEFFPRVLTQIEIAQAGGCQIVDQYICNADGVKIKEASSTCFEGPEYLKPVSVQEISEFVNSYILRERQNEADGFIEYLRLEYKNKGWSLTSYFYSRTYFYYIEARKAKVAPLSGFDVEYFRYYYDQKDYIATQLSIPLTQNNTLDLNIDPTPSSVYAFVEALSIPEIPDYRTLVYNLSGPINIIPI